MTTVSAPAGSQPPVAIATASPAADRAREHVAHRHRAGHATATTGAQRGCAADVGAAHRVAVHDGAALARADRPAPRRPPPARARAPRAERDPLAADGRRVGEDAARFVRLNQCQRRRRFRSRHRPLLHRKNRAAPRIAADASCLPRPPAAAISSARRSSPGHHRVDVQVRRELQEVDVGAVLVAQLLDVGGALGLRASPGSCWSRPRSPPPPAPMTAIIACGSAMRGVGLEARAAHRVQARAVGLAHHHADLRHGRLGHRRDHLRAVRG